MKTNFQKFGGSACWGLMSALLGGALLVDASSASAAPFTAGNAVVYRVGTGAAALSNVATVVFLDEYTPAGVLVQSIALPTADSGTNQTLTTSGTATASGLISRSADGRFILVPGFDAAPGTAGVATTATTAVTRVFGRIDASGTVDTSTTTTSFSAGDFRSATSADGSVLFGSGANTGVVAQTFGGSGPGTVVSSTATNLRQLNVFTDVDDASNQLYVGSGAGSIRLGQVGEDVPTTAGQAITALPGIPITSIYNGFVVLDLDPAIAGAETVYVADEATAATGGIQKYSRTTAGGTFTLRGNITALLPGSTTANAILRGLSANVSGGTVTLFTTTGAGGNANTSALYSVTDTADNDAAPSSTTASLIVTGATNTAFRGVVFAPSASTPPTPSGPTAYAISGTSLYSFSVAAPNTPTLVGDTMLNFAGIDFNPANGQLYGLVIGANVRLYTINTTSGVATAIGTGFPLSGTMGANSYDLTGQNIGFDFNPKTLQNDSSIRIRVTAQNGSDLRLNSATGGIAAVDGTLRVGTDTATPATSIVGSAYTNNVAQVGGTTQLFDIGDASATSDLLFVQNPPNNGTLAAVGTGLGVDAKADTGFDIFTDASGTGNTAYLATNSDGTGGSEFFTVDLAAGTATAAGNFGSLVVSDIAVQTLTPTPITSGVVISQLRLSGPGGASDEFIELANTTSASVVLTGLTLQAGGAAIPNLDLTARSIPAGGHFLITNSTAYSLTGYATGDVSYTGDIAVGSPISLMSGTTALDNVGTFSGFAPTNASNQYAYVRRMETGLPADTGNDTNDFNLVDVASPAGVDSASGVGPLSGARLGAPGPRNTLSPIQRNALIGIAPLNIPGVASDARMNSTGSSIDPLGRLSLRRTLTNKSQTVTMTRLRFRITAITAGTNTTASDGTGTADVRAISSSNVGVRYRDAQNNLLTAANGLALEAPSSPTAPLAGGGAATPPAGAQGGGLNSSWSIVNFPAGGIAPNGTLNVEFLLGIVKDGNYRLVVDAELLP